MTLNDILQATGVGLILLMAIVWIIRRATREKDVCGSGCEGCPIKGKCDSKKK